MSHNEWYDTQERIHLFVHPSLPVVQQNNSDPDFPQLAKKKMLFPRVQRPSEIPHQPQCRPSSHVLLLVVSCLLQGCSLYNYIDAYSLDFFLLCGSLIGVQE